MKRLMMLVLIVSEVSGLTACSTMNSSFDCPNKAGVSCKSLDQINGMVDNGKIRGRSQASSINEMPKKISTEFETFPVSTSYMPGQPLRYGETVQRVWIAPYEDNEGNYHQDSMVYAVMKGGHWIGSPVKPTKSL